MSKNEYHKYRDRNVNVHFLNHKKSYNISRGKDISDIISHVSARGGTPIGEALSKLFKEYLAKLANKKNTEVKPWNIIVITDGEPTDKDLVRKSIGDVARALKKLEINPQDAIGIQFFQVGDDKTSTKYLSELDDDLAAWEKIPDIVDSTTYKVGVPLRYTILKALLGGIDEDVDNNKMESLYVRN
ncbi:MAG: hypothetical protein Terrestrivirus2_67 [Terrestrivirus sp.]|uniref:VWFA domain-containing protein n=1 Tax=Terrestrivirus sp. TaxID=2487775 RepID=A0A3G4ZQ35_9VIRU|nr:MAG: hypothetical protein Terrestrivirus2_67 [Terrestrivirus sp.]